MGKWSLYLQFVLLSVPGCEISRSPPPCPAACPRLGRARREELTRMRMKIIYLDQSENISMQCKYLLSKYQRGSHSAFRDCLSKFIWASPRCEIWWLDSTLEFEAWFKIASQTDSCQTFSPNGLWIMIIVSGLQWIKNAETRSPGSINRVSLAAWTLIDRTCYSAQLAAPSLRAPLLKSVPVLSDSDLELAIKQAKASSTFIHFVSPFKDERKCILD